MPSDYIQKQDYYVDNDRSVLTFMNETYEQNSSQWLQFMYEGDIDTRFAAGDQEAIYNYISTNYNYYKRNQINFNLIRSIRNMISGHQRRTRKTSIVIPQEFNDQETADQLSGALMWTMQKAGAYHCISKAFEGGITAGMNLIATYLDYTDDPLNGDIKVNNISYNAFLIDPYFKKLDLSDCNYVWTRKWLGKDQIKMLLPGREDEIDALPYEGARDGKFPYMPESLNYFSKRLLPYNEFWYLDTKIENLLLDQKTGETVKWRGGKENLEIFLSMFPQITMIKKTIPTVKLAIVVNDKVFYHGPNTMNIDCYPFVPFVGYFEPEIPYFHSRIQGIVRDLRDSQWAYNRRMRLNLDYLEAGISRGVKYVEDSLVDPEDAFLSGAGRAIPIKKGHTLDEVQEIPPPQLPNSWFQEIEKLEAGMFRISGVNEELMGAADDDKAGILSMLRQGAGLTTLQPLFDNLDTSQNILANLFLKYMQSNFSSEKIERIINKSVTPLIKSKNFLKFDSQVIDGILTPTQQIMEFQQLWEMTQAGMPIPPDLLLKNAPLQNKNELIKRVTEEQQKQAQQAQEAQRIQMMEIDAKTNLANARAEADRGLGIERVSRVQENLEFANERAAKADEDRADAVLSQIKAIKEIQNLDIDQLIKGLQIIQQLKEEDEKIKEVKKPVRKGKKEFFNDKK
jgi:hypothetical protein